MTLHGVQSEAGRIQVLADYCEQLAKRGECDSAFADAYFAALGAMAHEIQRDRRRHRARRNGGQPMSRSTPRTYAPDVDLLVALFRQLSARDQQLVTRLARRLAQVAQSEQRRDEDATS